MPEQDQFIRQLYSWSYLSETIINKSSRVFILAMVYVWLEQGHLKDRYIHKFIVVLILATVYC